MLTLLSRFGHFGGFVVGGLLLRAALYTLLAGGFEWLAQHRYRAAWQPRKVQAKAFGRRQRRHDIVYSMSTLAIFSFFSAFAWAGGWTSLYTDVGRYGWTYLWASAVALLVLHDTWFYWMHRLLHTPFLFRHVHRIHHHNTNPTVWTALAFHPVEALMEGAIVPVALTALPLHPYALLLFFAFMLLANVEGHCGFEFRPRGFGMHPLWRLGTGSSYHNHHHRTSTDNYGLYLSLWDRLMHTFAPVALTQPSCTRRREPAVAASASPKPQG